MSVRLCVKCGYDLSGLPKEGTVVTCPECEHANDVAVPPQVRLNVLAPFLWAMVPATLSAVGIAVNPLSSERAVGAALFLLVFGLLVGAITAGVLEHRMIGREREMDPAPHVPGSRAALSVQAAILSVVFNAVVMFVVYLAVDIIRTV